MKNAEPLSEPYETLFRIQRALAGYVSYLAACDANTTFSEYSLYEPTLRVLMTRGYLARCEYPCPGLPKPKRGDCKKVDFEACKEGFRIAIEVKWAREGRLSIKNDHKKLVAFLGADKAAHCFLCIFGRYSDIIKNLPMRENFIECGKPVIADLQRTKYGCRIYKLIAP